MATGAGMERKKGSFSMERERSTEKEQLLRCWSVDVG